MWTVIVAAGIPTSVLGFCFWMLERRIERREKQQEAAEKAGYEHFMIKEIHEQPKAIRDTINSVVKDGKIDLSGVGLSEEEIAKLGQIYLSLIHI